MNALTLGSLIFLYVILGQSIGAFIQFETQPDFIIGECHVNVVNGTTVCETEGGSTFVETLLEVTVQGFNGAPDWFNDLWVFFHIFFLVLAGMLVVGWVVGLVFGGSG